MIGELKYTNIPIVRVPFFVTLRPKDPELNKWFGGPGLDSPQLIGCLRIK